MSLFIPSQGACLALWTGLNVYKTTTWRCALLQRSIAVEKSDPGIVE